MNLKIKLKELVEDDRKISGRVFNLVIMGLIILSVISISIETIPGIEPNLLEFLVWFERFVVFIFTGEYLLRIYTADHKLKYMFSFFGLIDLVAIVPFYFVPGIDLRAVRIFRLLRVFRIFKLTRYSEASLRLLRTFKTIRYELGICLMVSICVLYMSAVGIYYFEHPAQPVEFSSVFESLWWAVTTLTMLGYGDVYPVTTGGRFFTFVVLLLGIGLLAVPAGLIASALTRGFKE